MAEAHRIASAAQYVRDVGARLGTGNPGFDLTAPLADLLDRFAVAASRYENAHGGESGGHVYQLDHLVEHIEKAARNT
jgi:hypothetical protein